MPKSVREHIVNEQLTETNSAASVITMTLVLSIGYAVLRYHIAGPVMGMTGFLLVMLHALMSFLLFSPAVYSKFFTDDGTLTLSAGLSMLGGVTAFVVLWGYNMTFQTFLREDKAFVRFITSRKFMLFALLLGAAHLFFMGYEGWLIPADWHGGLPPISLVAFAFFAAGYVINLIGRE
jgi:hypothetical protein